jgi:NAD+ synthase
MFDKFDAEAEVNGITRWLRDYMDAHGKKKIVMGLSGGIDSAVVALIAGRALGPENLILIAMPYTESLVLDASNPKDLEDARSVAGMLEGCKFIGAPITSTVDAEIKSPMYEHYNIDDMAFSNLKARVRAIKLRTMANLENALVLGTENKTENLLGYFTLGGDEETDIEILSNYFKTEVRMLAAFLGVPSSIQMKAPSAGLWENQTDEGELGFTYAEADLILAGADLSGTTQVENMLKVRERMQATAFKREPRPVYPRA